MNSNLSLELLKALNPLMEKLDEVVDEDYLARTHTLNLSSQRRSTMS